MNLRENAAVSSLRSFYRPENLRRNKALKRTGRLLFSVGRAVFLFSLCLVLLYPLLIMLSISLRSPSELFDPTVVWIPKTFTAEAFVKANRFLNFDRVALRTAVFTILSTALQLVSCVLAGYGFARHDFPFKKALFALVIFSIIVPPQVVMIPSMVYFQNFDFFGLGYPAGLFAGRPLTVSIYNTAWSYYLPAALGNGIKSGLFIFIFVQFFRGLPTDLRDAAYMDGCGRFRTFLQIMLPLSGAAVLTVLLFSLVWYWNDNFVSALYFDRPSTVSTVLQNIRAELNAANNNSNDLEQIPQMQAAALMGIAPPALLYAFLQKYFTESIERTGLVG